MLLITGGSGYVGSYILEALEGKMPRDQVRVFARAGGDLNKLSALGYSPAAGSVTNLEEVRAAMQGIETLIHLVAIIRPVPSRGQTFDRVIGAGSENVVTAAKEAGVKHIIFMSALGATSASVPYFRNKMRAEAAFKAAGIPYTIFRPSLLIGPGGEFTGLMKTLTMFPIVPVLGGGRYPVQPMYVRDMARYFVQAVTDTRYLNQTFEVGGPEVFTFKEMLRQTLEARRKRAWLVTVPLFLIKPLIPVIDKLLPKLITRDQFTMLLEGSATTDRRLQEIGGFELTPYKRAIAIALKGAPPAILSQAKAGPGR